MKAKHGPETLEAPMLETREVLAGAYIGMGDRGRMLRHAVEVDDSGRVIRLFCRRVSPESLADREAGNPTEPPTCPSCQRALKMIGVYV